MLTVPQAASLWHQAGVSTIPIQVNGTKRPVVEWAEFQARIPSLGEIDRWWGNGHDYGLAVICGNVSGNVEMTELEGSVALNSDLMVALDQAFAARNLTYLWEGLRLTYSEWTPSGGIHLIYRISDGPVPGNEKIARDVDGKVLAETRGEGGYVIVAPTSGLCHPSGESWMLLGDSVPGQIPVIRWEEREQLHAVLRDTLDAAPAPSKTVAIVSPDRHLALEGAGSRPGDEWASRTSWADILERAGWTLSHSRGVEEFWVRPGKSRRDGHSATVNYEGSDLLKVFSSSVRELEPEATYTKFGAFAALFHGGDHAAAAKELARSGFGTPLSAPRQQKEMKPYIEEDDSFSLDDVGNSKRLLASPSTDWPEYTVRDVHRWVTEEKRAKFWNGSKWECNKDAMLWEADAVTDRMARSDNEAVAKTGRSSRSRAKQESMVKLAFSQRGMSVKASDFDPQTRYVNLGNGIWDLNTSQLLEHDPSFMLTRSLNASYNPQAKAPEWEAFLERALPDQEMRDYVQRCLGYTLLGTAAERAMFVIYGPSGTGKSTFLETLNYVFGEYGETAPAGTFRASKNPDDAAPTPALHRLRGKRFVTTSETSEGVQWNEELVKRYTGRDLMSSRGLYEEFQTWRSEASIWMATNHAPRFTSDDRAIWNRVKLVPFMTVFLGEGQRPAMDDVLIREADGILNWLLAGLASYRQVGLAEPGQVTTAVTELREQSDSVIRFVDDRLDEGYLVSESSQVMDHRLLYQMYQEWCRQNGERFVGGRRFTQRLQDSGRDVRLENRRWYGLGRVTVGWLAGTE